MREDNFRPKSGLRGSKSRVRTVDLSFQFHPETESTVAVPGVGLVKQHQHTPHRHKSFRPHTAHPTVSSKATHKAVRKVDYHRKLRDDIDKLLDDDETLKNSGNIQLDKTQQKQEYVKLAKALLDNSQPHRSRVSSGNTYRSNRTHLYLGPTELSNQPVTDIDLKLGRPTRTTLLRHRHRSNSAPLLPDSRADTKKEWDQKSRPTTACLSHREQCLGPCITDGESIHSFLTGARYNRAHHFDARSLEKYGVFLPRSNPYGCFIAQKHRRSPCLSDDETPPAPPETPREQADENYNNNPHASNQHQSASSRPVTARVQKTKIRGRQVWGNETISKKVDPSVEPAYNINEMYDQFLDLPENLNIKGVGVTWTKDSMNNVPRPVSAQKMSPDVVTQTKMEPIGRTLPRGLPTVVGSAIYTGGAHIAMPHPKPHPKPSPLTVRDISTKLQEVAQLEEKLRDAETDAQKETILNIPRMEKIDFETPHPDENHDSLTPPPNSPTCIEYAMPMPAPNDQQPNDDYLYPEYVVPKISSSEKKDFDQFDEKSSAEFVTVDDMTTAEAEVTITESDRNSDNDNVKFFLTEGGAGEIVEVQGGSLVDVTSSQLDTKFGAGDGGSIESPRKIDTDDSDDSENLYHEFEETDKHEDNVNAQRAVSTENDSITHDYVSDDELYSGYLVNKPLLTRDFLGAQNDTSEDETDIQAPIIVVDIMQKPKSDNNFNGNWALEDDKP